MKVKRKKELDVKWKKVAKQAVTDKDFRIRLATDPVAVMKEFEIALPEGVEAKVVTGEGIRLIPLIHLTDEAKADVKWWEWRLDMIREFGQNDKAADTYIVAPESEDGI